MSNTTTYTDNQKEFIRLMAKAIRMSIRHNDQDYQVYNIAGLVVAMLEDIRDGVSDLNEDILLFKGIQDSVQTENK